MQCRRRGRFLLVSWQPKESAWITTLLIDVLHPLRTRRIQIG